MRFILSLYDLPFGFALQAYIAGRTVGAVNGFHLGRQLDNCVNGKNDHLLCAPFTLPSLNDGQ